MRQGIIIFADAQADATIKGIVEAALATPGVNAFLAYPSPEASQSLRALVGGPPPRFFPQASRTSLGERMAQAFAFLFVQDYERVTLVSSSFAGMSSERLTGAFSALAAEPVHIESSESSYLIALRREDFPQIAPIFDELAWEKPGAQAKAEKILAQALSS